jgi:hypothetical protein
MRSAVLLGTALFFALPHVSRAWEAVPKAASGLTLILRTTDPVPEETVRVLEREVVALLHLPIAARLYADLLPNEQFANLVVIDLKGRCRVDARPAERLYAGALAFTHRSDGEILPFVDVLCDQLRNAIRPHMSGDHLRRTEVVVGRALGRVIAHELYHILGRTCGHGEKGVANDTLSGEQLLAENLEFEADDLQRIHSGGGE